MLLATAFRERPPTAFESALHQLAPDARCVLSGINQGGNLGADVFYSGTVAAVREGVLHGLPGLAISQYCRKDRPIDWIRTIRWVQPLLRKLVQASWTAGTFWNINLPHLEPGQPDPQTVFCPLDFSPLPVTFRKEGETFQYDGDYHQRQYVQGTDVEVCFRGDIAVTQVPLA